MKIVRNLALVSLGLAALSLAAVAQTSNPVSSALKMTLRQSSRNMVAAAAAMPEAKYSYRPTPGSRSFGELILHIAQSNNMMCQSVSGAAAAARLTLKATSPKAQLVAAIKASFDYCTQAFTKLNDSDLTAMVPFFGGRKITRAAMMFELTDDWSDHYSQEAAYLRKNGVLPPSSRKGSTI